MNGVHDLGGMHGMGPIAPERDEPVFHTAWEGRAFGLTRAMGGLGLWSLDASRFQRERIAPADYFRLNYYERWIAALEALMLEHGLVTRAEIDHGRADPGATLRRPALTADQVPALIARGVPTRRDVAATARFGVGQRVHARNINPVAHTRLPRYVRGKTGTVDRDHGVFVFPDTNAMRQGEKPQHLYSVRFAARELWGDEAGRRDFVFLDLWDDYLGPA